MGKTFQMTSLSRSSYEDRRERRSDTAARREPRVVAILLIGPLTMLAGLVWAVAQPYRIVFLEPAGKGLYDYLAQPPLLVLIVGLGFMVAIAPGLVADVEREDDGPET